MARRAHGLPLGSRRRTVVVSVALLVTLVAGALLALQDRPPEEPLEQVSFLVDRGHADGDIGDAAHRALDERVAHLADAVDDRRWDDALRETDAARQTLHEMYEEGRVQVHLARRIDNALDDLGHAIRGTRDR